MLAKGQKSISGQIDNINLIESSVDEDSISISVGEENAKKDRETYAITKNILGKKSLAVQ